MSKEVSKVEKTVLRGLLDLGKKAKAEEIAKKTNLKTTQVLSTIESLQVKNLVEAARSKLTYLEVTKEGQEYLDKRLPEIRLLIALKKKGKATTKELPTLTKMDKKEFNIALNWARKKGWVAFEKDTESKKTYVTPTEGGLSVVKEQTELEEALSIIAQEKNFLKSRLDPRLMRALQEGIERNLIKEKETSVWTLTLTEKGEAIAKAQEEVPVITRLNSDIIVSEKWRHAILKPYNIDAEPPILFAGKKHPYTVFLEEIRKILIGMGFVEAKGPFVEAEFWNFDVLFQAQDHIAREVHDSFIVKSPTNANLRETELVKKVKAMHEHGEGANSTGWGYKWNFNLARRLILRSQTTAVSARTLAKGVEIPHKMFSIDKVFRPDVLDRTHSMEFMQCEGIVIAENLTLRHLIGFLKQFAMELGFEKVKFKPSYFPFTEPSVEAFIHHPELGWIETLGAGLFRPEVLIPLGVNYPKVQVLAWGIGIDRFAMLKLGIDDIRHLHSQDLEWLRNKEIRW
ncbi:MAG: phenylalanine--tRNA ligase subunit alpha [Candidatus Odinarchaeota archaeon]|nr:phenylalanine--tRNA ligase subunit alpha [Candidatus Odinarchaeota archaeon]